MSPLRDGANGGRMDRQIFGGGDKSFNIFYSNIEEIHAENISVSSKMFIWIFTVTDRVKFLEYNVFLTEMLYLFFYR
jgi:hypothetical protein